MVGLFEYAAAAQEVSARVVATQVESIRRAATLLAEAIADDGVIHAFGTGHSRGVAMEIAGRAGGLVPTNRIMLSDLALRGGWPTERVLDPTLERDPGVAEALWDLHAPRETDAFVIASNSGGNGAVVEFARLARKHGHPVVALTSVAHSSRIDSRHPSGRKLMDVAEVVIDNCGPYGDAVLDLGEGRRACGVSTVASALAAQMLIAEVIGALSARGKEIPVYLSANVPGGDEHNDRLLARYGDRIHMGDA